METPTETLWELVETLLQSGKEPLARAAFRWCTEYAFLCGLKNAPLPIVITKFESSYRPLRSHLDARIERSWGMVAMSYRCHNVEVAKRSFVRAVDDYYRYAIEVSKQGAIDGGEGIWSVNTWH